MSDLEVHTSIERWLLGFQSQPRYRASMMPEIQWLESLIRAKLLRYFENLVVDSHQFTVRRHGREDTFSPL